MLNGALCHALRSSELDLHTHIDHVLNLIDQKEPLIQALLPEPDRYLRLHRAADELHRKYPDPNIRPPLFGVLFGVKDLFQVDGLPTQAGSKLPAAAFQGQEAEIVAQLKELGAIVLGKTVSTEFAYFHPGPTRNPLNPQHTPGGSSSGSAAAVAAGYCPFALGTQTIASIIRPAAYCGVYGYKPSYNFISTQGVFPFSQTADHVGFIADSLDTILLLHSCLCPQDNDLEQHLEANIGYVSGAYLNQADAEQKAVFTSTISELKAKGYQVQGCDLFPDIELLNAKHRKLIAAEFATNHQQLYTRYGHLYSEPSRQLYFEGLNVSAAELEQVRTECLGLRQRIIHTMSELQIGIWLTPATTSTAPLGLASTGSPLMSLPWTNAGLPSLTIPLGKDSSGLPMGMQIIGAFAQDSRLLLHASGILKHLYL